MQLNALMPQFSVTTGQSPDGKRAALYPRPACSHICDGTGNCIGIKILCQCPPSLTSYILQLFHLRRLLLPTHDVM